VEIVEENGEILQKVASRFTLEDGRERILAEKMIIEGGRCELDSCKEPAVWFHALPLNIRGTYLWERMVLKSCFRCHDPRNSWPAR
jgi:hypothetical protein